MTKNISWTTFTLILMLMAASCGSMVKSKALTKITIENNAIPPDFGRDKTILLCITSGKNSYDKYLKKHVTKEYHGRYAFISEGELNSDKYSNTNTYRYVFNRNLIYHKSSSYNNSTGRWEERTTTSSLFYIIDRMDNRVYKSPMTSSFFGKMIQAYMINLEGERLKYSR